MAHLVSSQFQVDMRFDESLEELAYTPGDLVAFDNSDLEMPQPFLLAITERLVKGFDRYHGIKLLFCPERGEREEWTLYTRGDALGLWTPRQRHRGGRTFPNFEVVAQGSGQRNPYFVEYACSGEERVLHALASRKGQGMDYYAACIRGGRLIIERGKFGKFMERWGFDSILPNQLRFK